MTLKIKTPPMPECYVVSGGRELFSEEQLAARDAQWLELVGPVVEALKGVLPYMEEAETAGLVGYEGCHWPVEHVRAALRAITEEQE